MDTIETVAAVLEGAGVSPSLLRVTVHRPGPSEVRVRMVASGICHTDLAYVQDAPVFPVVLGHEGSGIVESVGAEVTHLQPGDPVVINWMAKCRRCRWCLSGRPEFCENPQGTRAPRIYCDGKALNVMLRAGTFCPFVVIPAAGAIRIRPDLPLLQAALLGCAVATGVGAVLRSAKVQAGQAVAVIGAGGVGLNVVQGARIVRASPIIAVDLDVKRLSLARELGATDIVLASGADFVSEILAMTRGRGAEHIFEVVGDPKLICNCFAALARGGVLTLIGATARDAELCFQPRRFLSRQQTIQGCIYGNIRPEVDLPMFADWCVRGDLSVTELISRTVRLEEVPDLFRQHDVYGGIRSVISFC